MARCFGVPALKMSEVNRTQPHYFHASRVRRSRMATQHDMSHKSKLEIGASHATTIDSIINPKRPGVRCCGDGGWILFALFFELGDDQIDRLLRLGGLLVAQF